MSAAPARPLEGRVAVVTGASRGIGKGIARRLGAAGATVVVAARSIDSTTRFAGTAAETCEVIEREGGKTFALPLDLENPASRAALIADTIAKAGRLDILVNNAGTSIYKRTDDITLEEATAQVATYLLGPWDLCRQSLPHMRAQRRGWIVNIGSCVSIPEETLPYDAMNAFRKLETLYATLKTAMHRFTRALAAEIYDDNISANIVAPVMGVYTPGVEELVASLGMKDGDAGLEPVEHVAEAVLDMVEREPREQTGKTAFSWRYLDEIGRPTMTLDGRSLLHARP